MHFPVTPVIILAANELSDLMITPGGEHKLARVTPVTPVLAPTRLLQICGARTHEPL